MGCGNQAHKAARACRIVGTDVLGGPGKICVIAPCTYYKLPMWRTVREAGPYGMVRKNGTETRPLKGWNTVLSDE